MDYLRTAGHAYMQVSRTNTDGSVDAGFGTSGVVTVDWGYTTYNSGTAIGPGGAIYLSSTNYPGGNGTPANIGVTRLTSSGTLDTTFNSTGERETDLGNDEGAGDMAIQPDGKVLMAGNCNEGATGQDPCVYRFLTNGALDTSWHGTGWVAKDVSAGAFDSENGLVLAADGTVSELLYGASSPHTDVVRYTSAGALDPTFGTAGVASVGLGTADSNHNLVPGPDGSLYVLGQASNGSNLTFAAERLGSVSLPDYDGATNSFTGSTGAFGACLDAVGGGATAVWTTSATCPASNGAFWNPIPTVLGASARIATGAASNTANTVSLRYGVHVGSAQKPGAYQAPVVFDVIAPSV